MINLFFIHRFPFTKEAYIRDEFDYFLKRGYNVKYLDVSQFLKKKRLILSYPQNLEKHVIEFNSKKEFKYFIKKNRKNSVVISDVGFRFNSAWMYIDIFQYKIPYILFENAVLPKVDNKSIKHVFNKFFARFDIKKIYQKPMELVYYFYAASIKKTALRIISSKEKISSSKRSLLGKNTIVKYTSSLDYFRALNIEEYDLINEPYAVFIDQYFIHHPDFQTNHIIYHFTADEYYTEINSFLKTFSLQTGLKVVIAAHPRRQKENNNDFNSEFSMFYNKTAQLIKYAEITLFHFSTAINYSIIYNKPFLLLNSNYFKNSTVNEEINNFSNYFEVDQINVSIILKTKEIIDLAQVSINTSKYKTYYNSFIKSSDNCLNTFKEALDEALINEIV